MESAEIPSRVTQGTCHCCWHLEQSIFDMFGFDVPQGQRSVPLCDLFTVFDGSTVTLISGDAGESLSSMVGGVLGVFAVLVTEVLLLLRLSVLLASGCCDDCLVHGLFDGDDCTFVTEVFGCFLADFGAVTLVFGRKPGFVVSAILEIDQCSIVLVYIYSPVSWTLD